MPRNKDCIIKLLSKLRTKRSYERITIVHAETFHVLSQNRGDNSSNDRSALENEILKGEVDAELRCVLRKLILIRTKHA